MLFEKIHGTKENPSSKIVKKSYRVPGTQTVEANRHIDSHAPIP